MIGFYSKNNPSSIAQLFGLNILLKLIFLLSAFDHHAKVFPFKSFAVLEQIETWSYRENIFTWFICLILNFAFGYFINYLCTFQKLVEKNTLIPAFTYVLFTSFLPSTFWISLDFGVVFLLLLSINFIFKAGQSSTTLDQLLYAGILLSIIITLSTSFIIYLPFFFIILNIQKSIHIKDTLIFTIGVISFVAFMIALYWLISPSYNKLWGNFLIQFPNKIFKSAIIPFFYTIGFMLVAFLVQQNGSTIRVYLIKKRARIYRVLLLGSVVHVALMQELPNIFMPELVIFSAIVCASMFNIVLNRKTAQISVLVTIIVLLIQQIFFL
jgi:hypothetical protein